jgi:L-fuculose-phosphate aldolase
VLDAGWLHVRKTRTIAELSDRTAGPMLGVRRAGWAGAGPRPAGPDAQDTTGKTRRKDVELMMTSIGPGRPASRRSVIKSFAAATAAGAVLPAPSALAASADEPIRQKLIMAGKILVAEGQDDFTRGHISVRLPDNPALFYMKPHSIGLDEVTLDNILTIDLDGKVVAGTARRHSEVFIHSEIYKVRPDVACVIHTHPPHAVALSGSGRPLRAYSQAGALFYDSLGLYADTINLIRSAAMGASVARALGARRGVLLKNHGVAVVGSTIEQAVISVIALETAARIQLLAEAAGDPAPEFSRADIETLRQEIARPEQCAVNFDYLARRVRRKE